MSKKKLIKKVWYSSEVDVSGNPILPPLAENPEDLEGLHEGELFLHNSDDYPSIWIRTKNGLIKPLIGRQSNTPSYWEVRELPNGDTYLYTSLPIVTQSGVTMYADGGSLNLPSIYDGLPIDNNTIYWEDVDGYRVLKAKGGGGIAESVSWADITGKPEWLLDGKISYSEIEGTPDLSVYALKRSLSEYVTKTELTNLDYADKDWVKEYVVDINTGNITAITKQMVIEALGYTPYDNANPNGYVTSESIPSLVGYATEDWVIKKGYLTSIPSEYITESELTAKGYATASSVNAALGNKVDKVNGKGLSTEDFTTALKTKLEGLNNYNDTAISNAVTKLRNDFDALVDGDTSTAIDNFNEIIAFLNGVQDNQDLSSIIASIERQIAAKYTKPSGGIPKSDLVQAVQTSLGKADSALQSHQSIYTLTFQSGTFASSSFTANSGNKTINIPTTTSHVSEGSNLYFTNARAVSALGDTLKSYVTLSGSQTVSGEKNFTGGFKVNGSPIVYDAAKKYWKLEGDLLITGGLTMYGSDSSFTPSTIMDAIAVDGTTISKEGGVLKVIGGGGAITSITKQMVVNALGFTPISSSDIPKTLPNPYVLKFGTKEYDGNVSKTILASDLGALTAHQTIYSLTVKDSAGTTKLTYTPNSGTGSITLTKAMVGLGNVDNIAASGYLTALSSNTTNAVSITVGGTTKSITSATMKASLGLGSLAYKSSLTASDIPNLDWSKITSGKPTTLSGYGITDAKIASGVITLGSSSITPLTGITSALVTGALGYTPYNAANFTKANIKSTLGISDWALAASKPSYTWDDILGRPTLLSSFTDDVVAGKYLPLSGGTITIDSIYSLSVKRNGTGGSFVAYENNNGNLGFLGVGDDGVPKFAASDGVGKKIWHEGNFTPANYLPLSGGTISGDVVWKAGKGHNSILPGHIYRNLHGSSGNIYDHYYPISIPSTNTFANLRVWSNDNNIFKVLRFGGDGTFTWDGKTVIHSGNYSSYALPLTGGTISGDLTIKKENSESTLILGTNGRVVYNPTDDTTSLYNGGSGYPSLKVQAGLDYPIFRYDYKNYTLIHSGNIGSYALPLSGGSIKSSSFSPLAVDRDSDVGAAAIGFTRKNVVLGFLGFNDTICPKWYDSAYNEYSLIHSGNISDLLDSRYFKAENGDAISSDVNPATLKAGSYWVYNDMGTTHPVPITYSSLVVLGQSYYSPQLCVEHNASRAWLRGIYNTGTPSASSWHEIAFTDSNVASATKLATARTIWGQSFDGTGNVSGSINLGKNAIGYSLSEVWTDDEGNTHPWYGLDFSTPSKFATLSNWYGIRLSVGDKNEVITNGTFVLSNDSPSIIFRRGTTVDDYCDWTITNTGGYLTFKESTNGTERTALKMCYAQGIISDWNVTAPNFIGNLTGNAASATKLQTPRTIWGQSFDGTGDVSGMMYDHLGSEMLYSSGVWLRIGNGLSKKGYPTYIDGNIVYLRYGTGLNNGLILDSSGNVGIGTTSPSQKLHVDGNILTTGGVTMYSMRKLKNVVDERGLSLEELRTIKPTRYTWKDGRDNRLHFGGIADDIQQVLPEVVYNANGVLTMDYGNAGFAIASSLIKPVVDHEQRIKVLEKENEELKKRLNRYEA